VLAPGIKICPLGCVWGNQELPLFILGPRLIFPKLIDLEDEIWYAGRHIQVLLPHVKICLLGGV